MRRTLEMHQPGCFAGEGGGELYARRSIPNDTYAPATGFEAVRPARAMETRSVETIDTLDIGHARVVQYPGGRDDDVGNIARSAAGGDVPATVQIPATLDLGIEAYVLAQPVTVGDRLEVALNLTAARIVTAPFRIGREAIRIGMRRNVTGEPG